jgi:hypothetical protein
MLQYRTWEHIHFAIEYLNTHVFDSDHNSATSRIYAPYNTVEHDTSTGYPSDFPCVYCAAYITTPASEAYDLEKKWESGPIHTLDVSTW